MKKKLLFILFFIIFIIFFINITESNASFEVNYNGEVISLPDLPIDERISEDMYTYLPYFVAYSPSNHTYALYIPRSYIEGAVLTFTDSSPLYYKIPSSSTTGTLYGYLYRNGIWEYNSGVELYVRLGTGFSDILFSNKNIYKADGTSIYFNASFSFNLNFYEDDNFYQVVSSSSYFTDRMESLTATITDSSNNTFNLNYEYSNPDETLFMYYYNIYKNGTYTIKIIDSEFNKTYTFTINCTEIDEDYGALELHLSTTEQTTEPIYVLSNRYYYTGVYDASKDFLNNYDIDVSYGYDETYGYAPLSVTGYDEELQMYYCEYQFKIVVNGVYTFKILNFDTQEITYKTFNVSNIGIANKWGEDVYYNNYNEDGEFDPTPVLFLEYVDSTTVRIRTQPFSFNEIIMLQCFTKFEDGEYSQNRNIYNYTTDTGNTIYNDDGLKESSIDLYYFYLDVQVDGNYTFQFYNIELDKYTTASIDVNIRQFIIDNIDNIDKFSDKMIAWCKLHFGILSYPFELVINIVGRITSINFEEPIIYIPELKDPTTGVTFLTSTIYNLNSAVNINNTTQTLYNIYLVIVDVILIFLFINLCKKTFEEVFK